MSKDLEAAFGNIHFKEGKRWKLRACYKEKYSTEPICLNLTSSCVLFLIVPIVKVCSGLVLSHSRAQNFVIWGLDLVLIVVSCMSLGLKFSPNPEDFLAQPLKYWVSLILCFGIEQQHHLVTDTKIHIFYLTKFLATRSSAERHI